MKKTLKASIKTVVVPIAAVVVFLGSVVAAVVVTLKEHKDDPELSEP